MSENKRVSRYRQLKVLKHNKTRETPNGYADSQS